MRKDLRGSEQVFSCKCRVKVTVSSFVSRDFSERAAHVFGLHVSNLLINVRTVNTQARFYSVCSFNLVLLLPSRVSPNHIGYLLFASPASIVLSRRAVLRELLRPCFKLVDIAPPAGLHTSTLMRSTRSAVSTFLLCVTWKVNAEVLIQFLHRVVK